jgi:phosphoglycerate dehydrogenase-like enzyme
MTARPFPARNDLTICFAHPAYQMGPRFARRDTGLTHFEVKTVPDLLARAPEADVVVVSGFWRNEILDSAARLRFVQSISAGINQYDQARFRAAGVRLASAQGANEVAVAEHAMALMLGLKRLIHTGRDNQAKQHWRGMISDIDAREDESAGKTMLIVGYGRIGQRLARLARAFDMRVIGLKRNRGAQHRRAAHPPASGRRRGPDLSPDARDDEAHRRPSLRRHEAVGRPRQRCARRRRR